MPRQRGPPGRQGVRQPRPVQPDLLHRRQPREAPDRPPRQGGHDAPRTSSRTTCSSRPARAAPAASACTSPSTARRCATRASTASASCSSSRQGGLSQATGDDVGLEMNPAFFIAHRQGDRLRRRAQRARLPHPPLRGRAGRDEPRDRGGQEDRLQGALREDEHLRRRSTRPRSAFEAVKVDKLRATREGVDHRRVLGDDDRGRRQLRAPEVPRERGRRERHPAHDGVAALQHLGGRAATRSERADLRGVDDGQVRPRRASDEFGVAKRLATMRLAELGARASASRPSRSRSACYDYHLPDMDLVAEVADRTTTRTISAAAKATWRSAS